MNSLDFAAPNLSVFMNKYFGEYKSLTPTYLLKQDTSQLPDIDVSTMKKYLLNRKAQEYTSTSLRHYKLSRAYQHLDANYICNVNLCTIKVSCISPHSSDEAKIKHLHAILHKQTGEPYGGFCTCTVGLIYYWKKQLCLEKKSEKQFNKSSLLYRWAHSPRWQKNI
jgi:hypothetical protein